MHECLEPYRAELESVAGTTDALAATAALWNAAYGALYSQFGSNGRVSVVRYEDLAKAPVDGFRNLFTGLELTWTDAVAGRVAAATRGRETGNGRRFRWTVRGGLSKTAYRPMDSRGALNSYRARLSSTEIDRAAALTTEVRNLFYDDSDTSRVPKAAPDNQV